MEISHFIWSSTHFLLFSLFSPFPTTHSIHKHCSPQNHHSLGGEIWPGNQVGALPALVHLDLPHTLCPTPAFPVATLQDTHHAGQGSVAPPGDPGRESPLTPVVPPAPREPPTLSPARAAASHPCPRSWTVSALIASSPHFLRFFFFPIDLCGLL